MATVESIAGREVWHNGRRCKLTGESRELYGATWLVGIVQAGPYKGRRFDLSLRHNARQLGIE